MYFDIFNRQGSNMMSRYKQRHIIQKKRTSSICYILLNEIQGSREKKIKISFNGLHTS